MPFRCINDGDVAISEGLTRILETVVNLIRDADACRACRYMARISASWTCGENY